MIVFSEWPFVVFPSWRKYGGRILIAGPFAFAVIRKSMKEDQGIIAHEKKHLEQCKRKGVQHHSEQTKLNPNYRFESEAEAYAESVKHGWSLTMCAGSLYRMYNTGRTLEECKYAIQSYLD